MCILCFIASVFFSSDVCLSMILHSYICVCVSVCPERDESDICARARFNGEISVVSYLPRSNVVIQSFLLLLFACVYSKTHTNAKEKRQDKTNNRKRNESTTKTVMILTNI